MFGRAEDVFNGAALHDAAVIHHDHFVGDIGHHAEVVGDHEDRHAELFLQVLHQLEDLRLDRHIERRGRLVGDQERGPAHQGHGDHGALAQPARKLERVCLECFRGIRKADQAQHFLGYAVGLALFLGEMQPKGFADLIAHRVQGRKRGHRLLKDDRNAPAANGANFPAVVLEFRDVGRRAVGCRIIEQHLTARDVGDTRQNTHDRLRDDRFARAGFAHQGDGLAARDAKRNTVDRLDQPLGHPKMDLQVIDAQQVGHDRPVPSFKSSCRARPSAARF